MKSVGFEAVANADARVLILGTLPSSESLERRRYYARNANKFWWIMGQLVGAGPDMCYERRLDRLKEHGIALWDVCASADRSGSLDSKILIPTVVPNDFGVFFKSHTHLRLICFNGRAAEKLYRRKVTNSLDLTVPGIRHEVLPSTSPANAAMPLGEKLSCWCRALGEFIDLQAVTNDGRCN